MCAMGAGLVHEVTVCFLIEKWCFPSWHVSWCHMAVTNRPTGGPFELVRLPRTGR